MTAEQLIYQPESLDAATRQALESVLERDRARILYMGTDGHQNYVIVEASSFAHTRTWGHQHGVPLAFTISSADRRSQGA